MGKGVMLKKKGGENVYPVTASDLVYDPITKKNVKEELGGKVEEAPKNDKQYARINGTWAEVEAGAVSETALITLTPAVDDLNGVSVKVTTNEGETLLDTTWNGAQLSVQVRAGLQYTVAVGSKDGFIAPQAVTYTAIKGSTRSINMAYIESRLKLNILSNQGNDSVISSIKATVKYGSTSVQVANGGTVNLPLNVGVTITFPDVVGYKKPESISYTHTSGNYEKSGTYKTEIVKVNLSADNGQSVIGQIVTINGQQQIWNGNQITQKVPFDVQYSVSVNDKEGYSTPLGKSFTAMNAERELNMVYQYKPSGVFIQGISGTLYKETEWTKQEAVNGIAVITENCSFVIAHRDIDESHIWSSAKSLVSGVSVCNTMEEAIMDYNGQENTDSLIYNHEISVAAPLCNSYTFPNGSKGYLGSAGEWKAIADNFNEIDSALSKCNCQRMINSYWTSTQKDADNGWYFEYFSKTINYSDKMTNWYLRALSSI